MFPSYFPMDTIKRCLVSVVFLVNCVTFAIICAAMLTQEWTVVKPVRIGLNISLRNTEPQDPETNRFQGVINFGLFEGRKVLNYGFGNRAFDLKIVCASKLKACMYSAKENATERVRDLHENFFLGNLDRNITDDEVFNENLPNFNVWILTVSSLSLAAMFAITGGVFAVVNAVRNSVELVFGFVGILVWNALGDVFLRYIENFNVTYLYEYPSHLEDTDVQVVAQATTYIAICSLITIFSWLVQYLTKFRHNVMTMEELEQHWVSEYRACVGFSFYLVVISTVLFMITVSTLAIIIKQPWVDRRLRSELRKKLSSRNFVPHSASSTMTKKSKDGIVTA